MPLALLLSPDDQAVSAITAVLEELSVTCERPLDGVSAAKQLNSRNFDLVLVDCENLPAAKLIFDVCRRGKGGKNPVAIAIVDGRAGLPTAFRLGAELILTKPVAKDQARTSIRTAVNRVKKDEPEVGTQAAEAVALDTAQFEVPDLAHTEVELPVDAQAPAVAAMSTEAESLALGAAAGAGTSSSAAAVRASASTMPAMSPAIADAPSDAITILSEPNDESLSEMSEDPVLAELDRADAEKKKAETKAPAPPKPVFSAYQESEKKGKGRGLLLALVVIALVCAGVYAAWISQPGFRTLVEPQLDSLLALAGMERHALAPAPQTVKPVAPPAPVSAPVSTTGSGEPSSTATNATSIPEPAAGTATSATAPNAATDVAAQPASGTAAGSNLTPSATATAPANKVDSDKANLPKIAAYPKADSKNGSIALAVGAEASGEKAAVILSSKGAEKRLIHSVQPAFPASAGASQAEGTVVLRVVVDENGKVAGTEVKDGNGALAESAVAAVKQWRYRPYLRDGKPVSFETVILVDFQHP